MSGSYSSLCTDFYINQKIGLKMDLPAARETVLHLFDRVRREFPRMDQFRRYEGELSLESADDDRAYAWASLRQTSVRSGWVNPDSPEQAYRLHRLILDTAPYFLSISPLDIEHLELVFGFDFEAGRNRDETVFDALLADSPLAALIDRDVESIIDAQPFIGIALDADGATQAFVEVKTRARPDELPTSRLDGEPISVYLTVRRVGGLRTLEECGTVFATLAEHAERLADQRVVPHVVAPIHRRLIGA
jgi:hypothetical protein